MFMPVSANVDYCNWDAIEQRKQKLSTKVMNVKMYHKLNIFTVLETAWENTKGLEKCGTFVRSTLKVKGLLF